MKKKLLLTINLILSTLVTQVAAAEICRPEIMPTLWPEDQIIVQYECQNENVKFCVTKAIWKADNKKYISIKSTSEETGKYALANTLVRTVDDEVGAVSENKATLRLYSEPSPAMIIDAIKLRHDFTLNKISGQAKYILSTKNVSFVSFLKNWKISISENLLCTPKNILNPTITN